MDRWAKSVFDENKGDDECVVAALDEESIDFFEASPVVTRTRCNKGMTRKKLEFAPGSSKENAAAATSRKENGDGHKPLKTVAVE